jgi:hypothetical protein
MNESLPSSIERPLAGLPAWLLALLLSLLASVAVLLPFFRLGCASGHDFEFHVASWLDVAYQWKHGVLYPHWTAWTNYGFGEPRYIFYPPLSWMLGAALTLILPISWVPAAFVLFAQTLAGMSAFSLLRRLCTVRSACLGAAFYAANPYALLVSYIRSDFAEQLACAFYPLLLLAALRLAELLPDEKPKLSAISAFAIPFAAIWLCNAPAGVIASYSIALLFAWTAFLQKSWWLATRGAAGLALGLGLTGFYLVPAAHEQRWVNIGQALSTGLLPAQNFLFTRVDDVEHTWFNYISSYCALFLILFTAATALASRRIVSQEKSTATRKTPWQTLLLLGAAATLLMLRFTLPLWNLLPKLRFVQFPWRWMSLLAVICSCFLAAALERRRGWLWFCLFIFLSVPLGIFLVRNTWWDPDEMPTQMAAIEKGTGFEGVDEYDPLGDDHLDLPKRASLVSVLPASDEDSGAPPPAAKIQMEFWRPQDHRFRVESPTPAGVALRLLNYPAWQVTVNGHTIAPQRPDDVNQMIVPIAAGKSEIEVRFVRTPDRTTGIALSLFSSVFVIALWGRAKRQDLSSAINLKRNAA